MHRAGRPPGLLAGTLRAARSFGLMKPRPWLTLVVATLLGAAIWALSPVLAGYREPWDADGLFFVVALAVTGAVAGAVSPRPLWAHYVGSVVGQLVYQLLFLRIGALFILGALFLLGYSLIFLFGATVASRLRITLSAGSTGG